MPPPCPEELVQGWAPFQIFCFFPSNNQEMVKSPSIAIICSPGSFLKFLENSWRARSCIYRLIECNWALKLIAALTTLSIYQFFPSVWICIVFVAEFVFLIAKFWVLGVLSWCTLYRLYNATKFIVLEIQNHISQYRRFGIEIQDLAILCLQGHGQQGDKISIHRKCLKFNPCLSSCVGRVHRQQWNTGKKAYFRQNCWKILRIQVLPVFC